MLQRATQVWWHVEHYLCQNTTWFQALALHSITRIKFVLITKFLALIQHPPVKSIFSACENKDLSILHPYPDCQSSSSELDPIRLSKLCDNLILPGSQLRRRINLPDHPKLHQTTHILLWRSYPSPRSDRSMCIRTPRREHPLNPAFVPRNTSPNGVTDSSRHPSHARNLFTSRIPQESHWSTFQAHDGVERELSKPTMKMENHLAPTPSCK